VPDPTDVRLSLGTKEDLRSGLFGYVRCRYGDLRIDGLTLRKNRRGRLVIGYPAREDSRGGRHAYVRPANRAVRRQFEAKILEGLDLAEGAP